MSATNIIRWTAMLSQLNVLQVIAFPGTQQERHALEDPALQVFSQQLKNFHLYHWCRGTKPFSNSATGVTLAIRRDFASKSCISASSPPDEVCGRAGVLIVHRRCATYAIITKSFHLPRVSNCSTWKRTVLHLQLTRRPCLRDHVPVVVTLADESEKLFALSLCPWDYDKKSMPKFFRKDWTNFREQLESAIVDGNMEERLSVLTDDRQVDQAWMLLQDLLLNTTQAFRKTDSRKLPPSDTTVQLREEKQHAWEKRVEAFT